MCICSLQPMPGVALFQAAAACLTPGAQLLTDSDTGPKVDSFIFPRCNLDFDFDYVCVAGTAELPYQYDLGSQIYWA